MKTKLILLFSCFLFLSCNKDVVVDDTRLNQTTNTNSSNTGSSSGSSNTGSSSGSSNTGSSSGSSNTGSSSGSSNTGSTSNETCSLNDEQTGTYYELRIPDFNYLNSGDQIVITMYSSVFSNSQVKNISLYKNDEFIHSWGNWLTLSSNQRNLVLPSSLASSSCYNIRVFEEGPTVSSTDDESYISRLFEIRSN